MPDITELLDMEFEDSELEPTILPLDARLSLRASTEELRTLFDRLTAVAPQKEVIVGTSFVHVAALDGAVRFTVTDGSQTLIIETTTIRIVREGRALLPAHKLKSIFALAPEQVTTLTVLANTATITSGRAIWNIITLPGDKLHAVPDIDDVEMFDVPRRALYKALVATKRALPALGMRKSLEQVNIVAGAATASDGYRLIRQRVDGFPKALSLAVPKDTVDELVRSLSAGEQETIQMGSSDSLIVVRDAGNVLVSRRLVLDYPDLESQLLTPALENQYSLTLDKSEMRALVKRVRISADPEYAAVTLRFGRTKEGQWELTVVTRDRSGNSASESMFALWEGDADPFDITLNHKYLIDMLEAYSGSLVTLRIGVNTKTRAAPLLLRDDDKGFTAVIQQSLGR